MFLKLIIYSKLNCFKESRKLVFAWVILMKQDLYKQSSICIAGMTFGSSELVYDLNWLLC